MKNYAKRPVIRYIRNCISGYINGYMKGSLTVEAALVFPIIMFVILAFIRFGFTVHDVVVSNMLEEYIYARESNILCSSYNPMLKETDIGEIVNSVPFNPGNEKKEIKKAFVRGRVQEYGRNIMMGTLSWYPECENKNRIKNSTVVRIVHIFLKHGERLVEGID